MAPEVLIGNDDWLFIRQMVFHKAGDQEPEHTHAFAHYTVLFKGSALFKVKGKLIEEKAPAMVFIDANEVHQITALEDDTHAACIHYTANIMPNNFPPRSDLTKET